MAQKAYFKTDRHKFFKGDSGPQRGNLPRSERGPPTLAGPFADEDIGSHIRER